MNYRVITNKNKSSNIIFLVKFKNLAKAKNSSEFQNTRVIEKSNFLIVNPIKVFKFLK